MVKHASPAGVPTGAPCDNASRWTPDPGPGRRRSGLVPPRRVAPLPSRTRPVTRPPPVSPGTAVSSAGAGCRCRSGRRWRASIALLSLGIVWVASRRGRAGRRRRGRAGSAASSTRWATSSPARAPTPPPTIADAPTRRAARGGVHQRRRRRRDGERAGERRRAPTGTRSACGSRSRTASPQLVEEVPVGPTSVLVIPEVELEQGPQRHAGLDHGAGRRERAVGGRRPGSSTSPARASRSARPRTTRRRRSPP